MAIGRFRKREAIQSFKGETLGTLKTWQYYPSKQLLLTQTYKTGADILERKEECNDELHKPLDHFSVLPKGGPLDLRSVLITNPFTGNCDLEYRYGVTGWTYSGRFMCGKLPSGSSLILPASSAPEAASYGPQAWNKFRPGRPSVNMGVFVGELRDLPGMLKETCSRLKDLHRGLRDALGKNFKSLPYELVAKKGGKQLAQDFLSYQFGWAPFVSDLRKAYELSQKIDRSLNEIRSNNGKVRRRGGVLLSTSDSVVEYNGTDYGAFYPTLPTQMYLGAPRYVRSRVTAKRIWFKGAFRYWIPDTGTLQWERRTTRLLYGLTLNAEVAWQLIPWSWLADWFGNIGDNIASFDNGWADNLTAKYAYVMAHDTTVVSHNCVAPLSNGVTLTCDSHVEYHSKARVAASPYGFDVSFDSLNGRRLAILAALGITRLRAPAFFK